MQSIFVVMAQNCLANWDGSIQDRKLKLWLSQPNHLISNHVFIANPGWWYALTQ